MAEKTNDLAGAVLALTLAITSLTQALDPCAKNRFDKDMQRHIDRLLIQVSKGRGNDDSNPVRLRPNPLGVVNILEAFLK